MQGPDCVLQFEVWLSADVAGTYHSSTMVYFDYNPAVFGTQVYANGKISYDMDWLPGDVELLAGNAFGTDKYVWVNTADNAPTRVAFTFENSFAIANAMFMNEVTIAAKPFLQVTMVMTNPGLAGIDFTANTGAPTFVGLMDGNQFYLSGATEVPYGIAPSYAGFYDNDLLLTNVTCAPPPPGCATLVSPLDAATGVSVGTALTWNAEATATGYKLYFGTDYPPTNINNGTDLFNVLTYTPGGLLNNQVYYWSIVPYNGGGDAVGCTPWAFTTEVGYISYTWNGTFSADWFTPGNWTPNGIPTAIDPVTIPVTLNNPVISANTGVAATVAIAANAMLTIAFDGDLVASGLVTNDGQILVLSDGNSMVGDFIDGGMAGNGTFYIERPIKSWVPGMPNCQDNSPFGWHYISSPLAGINYQSVPMGDYWINAWDETISSFYNYAPGSGPSVGQPCIAGAVNNWVSGVGYSVRWCSNDSAANCEYATGTVIEFAGANAAVHTGNVIVPMTNTPGVYAGWNLLGNPYPSTWDYELWYAEQGAFIQNDAIYFWDDVAMQYAAWVFGMPVNGGTNYVEPGQGFFWNTPAPTQVTFANSQRSTMDGVPYYYKNSQNVVSLKVTGNGYSDETVIRFMDDASVAFDGSYDAYKLLSADFVPSLYTGSGDEIMSINSQPATDMVPMSFQTSVTGTYTIEAIGTSDFANVVLEDLVTGVQTNLLTDSYTFNYTAGENAARFIVHFTPLGSPELEANSIQIYANQNNIIVNVPVNVNGEVVVYNVVGQEIAKKAVEAGVNTLTVSDVNTVYIVKVMANNSVITEKVYIK